MAYRNNYDDLLRDIQSSGQVWSDFDLQIAKEDPDAGRSIFTQKQKYANAQTDAERQAANSAAEMLRAQYGGYTAGGDGSGFMKIPSAYKTDKEPNYAPEYTQYTSKYTDQIDSLLEGILNRDKFSYDPASDPSYQAYSEMYRNLGNQARQQAMGDAAAMTGGQLNSYALVAGQQAQDRYNAQMSDAIPQLQQLAYQMYLGDLDQQRADLSTVMGLDDMEYGRHQDAYDRQFQQWQANYGVDRDIVSDYRYEEETNYDRALDRAALLAQVGDFSGYYALGLNDSQIAELNAANRTALAGSDMSNDVQGELDPDGLFLAAYASGMPSNFIASNYKDYGFEKSTGLQDEFETWRARFAWTDDRHLNMLQFAAAKAKKEEPYTNYDSYEDYLQDYAKYLVEEGGEA